MFQLSQVSLRRLEGVSPRLVAVVKGALAHLPGDMGVLVVEGVRSVARQHELYGWGRTAAQCRAVGVDPSHARPGLKSVTWVTRSNHNPDKTDGLGHAVDLAPSPLDWSDPKKFDAIARAMFASAKELSEEIRWGADWDRDGKPRERGETDSPHFELAKVKGAS